MNLIYTIPLKSLVSEIFKCFLKISILYSPRLHLFDQKSAKNNEIFSQFKQTVFYFYVF